MNKLVDWKNRLKKGHMLSVICVLLIIVAVLGIILWKKQTEYRQASENSYNMAFYELVDYVENVETYLAKSVVSSTPDHGAETLTNLWREANLAQSYLSRLPIESQELENTEKLSNYAKEFFKGIEERYEKTIYLRAKIIDSQKDLPDNENLVFMLNDTIRRLKKVKLNVEQVLDIEGQNQNNEG